MRGDQTLRENSQNLLEGGREWPSNARLTGVLSSGGIPDTSAPVLNNAPGDSFVQLVKQHWPILLILLALAYCVYHYKFKKS